jgi:hypothetical protein
MAVLAPSLARARTEINQEWPRRDHSSDGWIGDAAHRTRPSDHNPNRRGVVDAIDIDVDGIPCALLVAILITHPAVNYVIWNRTIWSRTRGFRAAHYTGPDPHTGHIHVSDLQTVSAENTTTPWRIAAGVVVVPVVQPTPTPESGPVELAWRDRLARALPVVRKGSTGRTVRRAQALLNVAAGNPLTEDGGFGPKTDTAVRSFQSVYHLTVDGVVGGQTWTALVGALPTLRRGATGVETRRAQALLNVFGAGIREDGDFGGGTDTAVRAFQSHYGLTRDGVVGPATYTALLTR